MRHSACIDRISSQQQKLRCVSLQHVFSFLKLEQLEHDQLAMMMMMKPTPSDGDAGVAVGEQCESLKLEE